MNRVYKLVWSKVRNCYVVASELAKRNSKGGSKARAGISGVLIAAGLVTGLGMAATAEAANYDADYEGALVVDIDYNPDSKNYSTDTYTYTKDGKSYTITNRVYSGTFVASVLRDYKSNTSQSTVLFDYKTPGNTARVGTGDQGDETNYQAQTANNNGKSVFGASDHVYGLAIGRKASIRVTNPESTTQGENNGVAIGDYAQATGGLAMALGHVAQATKTGAMAIGVAAAASDFNTLAIMRQSLANNDFAAAIGTASVSTGTGSFAMGYSSTAVGDAAIAIGSVVANRTGTNSATYDDLNNTQSMAEKSIVIGAGAKALNRVTGTYNGKTYSGETIVATDDTGRNAIKSGNQASNAVVIGTNAVASSYSPESVVIGSGAMVGEVNITRNNQGNVTAISQPANTGGAQATAIGYNALATKNQAFALGAEAAAKGVQAAAVGYKASATADNAFALGANASATAAGQAIGNAASVEKDNAVAIGNSAKAAGTEAIAIGYKATVTGAHSVAIGDPDNVEGDNTFVIANNVDTDAANAVIIGNHAANNSDAFADYAVALGDSAQVSQEGGVALGNSSLASIASGIAGYDPKTGEASTDTSSTWKSTAAAVSVGDVDNDITRQITSVAAGTEDTDAVNVAQLRVAAEAAATEVAAGTNVSVTPSEDPDDGHMIYTVSATDTTYKFETTKGSGNVVSETKVYSSTDGTTYTTEVGSFRDTDTQVTAIAVTPGTKTNGKTTYTVTLTDNSPNTLTTTFDVTDENTTYTIETATGSGNTVKTYTVKDSAGTTVGTIEDTDTKYTAGTNVSISDDNKISATDTNTTYTVSTAPGSGTKGDVVNTYTVKDSTGATVGTLEDTNTVLDTASTGLTLGEDGLSLSVKDTASKEVKSTVSLDKLKEAVDTNTHNNLVVADGSSPALTVTPGAAATTGEKTFTIKLDEATLKDAIDTNTTNVSVSVTGDDEKTITITDSANGKVETTFTDNDTKYTAGTNVSISESNEISATDTNTTNTEATITADNNKLKFSVKDSDGNTVTSNEVDISALASDTVLDKDSTGLTLSGDGLQLSVKDTAGNEVSSTVSLDDLKDAIDTNTNTSVVSGDSYVTVTKTKDATDEAGPEYTVTLNTTAIGEAVNTNTHNKLELGEGSSTALTLTEGAAAETGEKTYTLSLDEAALKDAIDTNTHNKLELGEGSSTALTLTEGAAAETGEKTYTLKLDEEALKEAIDTRNTVAAGDKIKVTEEKNEDGSSKYTVSGADVQGSDNIEVEYNANQNKFTVTAKDLADTNLTNITNEGETVIKNIAQDAVKVEAGDYAKVTSATGEDGNVTYTVSGPNVAAGDNIEVAYNANDNRFTVSAKDLADTSLTNITNEGETVIKNIAQDAVKVEAGDYTKVTSATGEDGNVTYTVTGANVAGSDNIEVEYNANQNKFTVSAKDLANTDLTNITNEGETVIKNIVQDAVKVEAGDYAKVTSATDDNNNVTYTVSGPNVVAGDNIEVTYSGDDNKFTVATAADVKFENVEVTNEFKAGDTVINEGGITTNSVTTNEFKAGDTVINEEGITTNNITTNEIKAGDTVINEGGITTNNITTENIDAQNIETKNINVTENITYKGNAMVTDVTYEQDVNTLYVTKGDEVTEYVLKAGVYEGDNKTINISEGNVISVIEGTVAEGDTGVVTGDTVYKEVRVQNDGHYVKKDNTTGENLTALDEQVYTNTNNIENINNQINNTNAEMARMDNRMKKGLAGAAALAMLHPMDFNPDDKLQFSAGVGNYRGETAAAVGAFYRPDENIMLSVGGTFGNGDNMVAAGVTFGLDGKNRITRSRTAMAHEIVELKGHIAKQDEQIAKLTELVNKLVGPEQRIENTVMFPDVPENHWAYQYIDDLQKQGIIEGYPDGLFKGDRSMTRYEFAAMLDRALRNGAKLDAKVAKEFAPELSRIRVERIAGEDNDRNKIERVRVNNEDKVTRDAYGSKIVPKVPTKAAAAK